MRATPDRLSEMPTRLKLTGIWDQLDGLLHEADRQEPSLRKTPVLLRERDTGALAEPPPMRQARGRRLAYGSFNHPFVTLMNGPFRA